MASLKTTKIGVAALPLQTVVLMQLREEVAEAHGLLFNGEDGSVSCVWAHLMHYGPLTNSSSHGGLKRRSTSLGGEPVGGINKTMFGVHTELEREKE